MGIRGMRMEIQRSEKITDKTANPIEHNEFKEIKPESMTLSEAMNFVDGLFSKSEG